ncbi:nuclear transport factor 2 family protein [Marmoricola endophyticus]|nr:nuclear transport factor 2 family protein [Marmoricola endophyticus]
MPQRDAIHDLVGRFVAALGAQDAAALADLFTDDAVHDDPTGEGQDVGPERIREFYAQRFHVPVTAASLEGPTAIHGPLAAFRVVVEIPAGRTPFRLLTCYLADVGPTGQFRSLRAVPDPVALNG